MMNLHISEILGPFANLTLSYQWVDMLKFVRSYDITLEHYTSVEGESSVQYNYDAAPENAEEEIIYQVRVGLGWRKGKYMGK